MKTVLKDAERHLLEILETRINLPGETYCLHIAGSAFAPPEFESLPRLIETWIGHEGGEIIICHDKDIFAFSSNLSEKSFLQFKERFHDIFAKTPSGIAKPLSFYNLSVQGLGLIELAKSKIAAQEARRHEEISKGAAHIKALKRAEFMSIKLNEDLKGTVVKRRQLRSKPEILVVEDDPFSRKLIAAVLHSFSVTFAEDGYSALIAYLQKAPDITFLDIDLPDVTGNDVMDRVLSFDPSAYIVMLSGNSQPENVLKSMKAGAKGFIGKPFTKDKVLQYIAKCPRNSLEQVSL